VTFRHGVGTARRALPAASCTLRDGFSRRYADSGYSATAVPDTEIPPSPAGIPKVSRLGRPMSTP
jgi:hypothetical protein